MPNEKPVVIQQVPDTTPWTVRLVLNMFSHLHKSVVFIERPDREDPIFLTFHTDDVEDRIRMMKEARNVLDIAIEHSELEAAAVEGTS